MDLLESLLDALVRLQGDALVLHAGEKPYVVTTSPGMQGRGARTWGHVELPSRVLTQELVSAMVGQILPAAQRQALDELGAIEHEIPAPAGAVDRFTVVAARGGDDIWLEVRRQGSASGDSEARPSRRGEEPRAVFEDGGVERFEDTPVSRPRRLEAAGDPGQPATRVQPAPGDDTIGAVLAASASALFARVESAIEPPSRRVAVTDSISGAAMPSSGALDAAPHEHVDQDGFRRPAEKRAPGADAAVAREDAGSPEATLASLLRTAAARDASLVYVLAGTPPMARIGGDFSVLEGLPALSAAQIEEMLQSMPAPEDETAVPSGQGGWLSDVPGAGRVLCKRFRDHRGPGATFRLVPASALSADHLRLPEEIRNLCFTDGVVIVSGPPGSGRSTLVHGIVDLINRVRSDHVITVEWRIHFVHTSARSFISQREPGPEPAAAAAAVREALREDPDVLVIEDVASADVAAAALQAVHPGRLMVLSIAARSPAEAIATLVDLFPEEERARVRASLATALRAVICLTLVRNATGGRTAAREILFNTPSVSVLVADGRVSEVRSTGEGGDGHVTLDAALASLVRDGAVHVAEACRKASDRAAFVKLLQREGIDTTFAEKLA